MKTFILCFIGKEERNKKIELLKIYLQKELEMWIQPQNIKSETGTRYEKRKRDEIYVHVTMSDWLNAHDGDKEHYLRSISQVRRKVKMNELLNGEEKFILIRGIAGIGKTSFIDYVAWKWSIGNLYQEYAFVVNLKCREINLCREKASITEILQCRYWKNALHQY